MNITDVRIRKITTEGKMKAIVSITFNEEFVIHDIKVIEGQNGLFIAMPSRKTPDGEFKDIAHPINSTTREKIQKAILDEYEKVKNSELQFIKMDRKSARIKLSIVPARSIVRGVIFLADDETKG